MCTNIISFMLFAIVFWMQMAIAGGVMWFILVVCDAIEDNITSRWKSRGKY
jgi:hypothetical protein